MIPNQVTAAELADALRRLESAVHIDVHTRNADELSAAVIDAEEMLARYYAQQSEKPACTGLAAVWCPRCGDCTCDLNVYGDRDLCTSSCKLHGTPLASHHAESERRGELKRELPVCFTAEEADDVIADILDGYDPSQLIHTPALSDAEQVAVNVVRAHERATSTDMSSEFYDATAERDAALDELGEALRKRGTL